MTLSRFRLTIAQRLYVGFIALALIACVQTYVSRRMATVANSGLTRREVRATHRRQVVSLRAAILELQRNAQVFTYTGHEAIALRARDQLQELRGALLKLRAGAPMAEQIDLVDRLGERITDYEEGFLFAVEERRARDDLVHQRLRDLHEQARQLQRSGAIHPRAWNAIVSLELAIHRYLVDPDYSLLTQSTQAVRAMRSEGTLSADADRMLDEYLRSFTQIVQATRSYMTLINVVLAGHTMDFAFELNQLFHLADKQVDLVTAEVAEANSSASELSLYLSLVTVAVSIWLAVSQARGVSRPLRRITETLRALANGERGMEIPGIERADEIGVMARAAEIFREKNDDTARLLEETRTLASSLEHHRERLERSNEELEQFVHTASHDLKAPLVTSSGFLGMIRELTKQGQIDLALKKMDTVERAHRRMNQLLSDLLDFSRVGRTDLERTELHAEALIQQTLDDVKTRYRGVKTKLGPIPIVVANESRFLQTFENLVTNAAKYGGEHASIEIGAIEDERSVRIFVKDDGPGIAPEYHTKVFQLFQRVDDKTEGTGVGLAIVARVMKAHGGRVWVESNGHGSGATFWLEFPKIHDTAKERAA